MNKDINKTLMALVPILKMNGENVTSIEAVHDWYKVGDREYMKEVAEITYDNGTVRYADIGCDSNLTAIYDVIAVIQQIKPRSKAIERIERGVYSLPPAQPEQQWIPCSERLPEHGGRYLISVLDGINRRTTVAPYLPRCKAWTMNGRMAYWKVIAWLPLPEPYREEEQDG